MFTLSLPPQEADFLRSQYRNPHIVLEYGSGGSSFLALEGHSNTKLYSCETDKDWLDRLCKETQKRNLSHRFTPIFCDIGPTENWGYPCFQKKGLDWNRMLLFMDYAITPWKQLQLQKESPTIILIDGRFRVASFVTTLAFVQSKALILFDDYTDRPYYHSIERLLSPTKTIGRMSVFQAHPGLIQPRDILDHFKHYLMDWR